MNTAQPVIEVSQLVCRYGHLEAVHGLSLSVAPGRCYGFFGRNGAGKTTTIKCLLNLLRPASGSLKVFGVDPREDDVSVKARIAYVPDTVGFYPWMRVRDYFAYLASFRPHWNRDKEAELLRRFSLAPERKVMALSRGQKMQVALIAAICPEPELLVLDEPTSGLDPLVRREFIRTIIGAYQDGDPTRRTVFVSTHLISEFEGLIDEFTIIDQGREVVSLGADAARERYRRLRARFPQEPPKTPIPGALSARREGRELEVIVNGRADEALLALRASGAEAIQTESLTLEEVFLNTVKLGEE
jgi:ABC-2 type transport system ATP-binding protein